MILKRLVFASFFFRWYFYYFAWKMSQKGKECRIRWLFERSCTMRTWLIKMERCEKHVLTLFEDGYVVDNRGKKLFVLKKSAMEMVQELINEYSADDSTADFDQDCIIKCNTNPKLVSHNRLFFNQIVELLFDFRNIKHPDSRLGSILEEIQRLRTDGKLQEMIETSGQDACYR